MVAEVYDELTEAETAKLLDFITGQLSDGWGEGFEQRPVKTNDGEIFVSFWNSDHFFIKPERELKQENEQYISEQTMVRNVVRAMLEPLRMIRLEPAALTSIKLHRCRNTSTGGIWAGRKLKSTALKTAGTTRA